MTTRPLLPLLRPQVDSHSSTPDCSTSPLPDDCLTEITLFSDEPAPVLVSRKKLRAYLPKTSTWMMNFEHKEVRVGESEKTREESLRKLIDDHLDAECKASKTGRLVIILAFRSFVLCPVQTFYSSLPRGAFPSRSTCCSGSALLRSPAPSTIGRSAAGQSYRPL